MVSEYDTTTCELGECVFGRQCVRGTGPLTAKIMLIGEAPGQVELKEGQPFVGRSGVLLDKLLVEAGLSRADIYVTNTCGCVDMSREDKRPLPAELAACKPRLDTEIALIMPRVILLVGNTAIQNYFPGYRVGEVYNRPRALSPDMVVVPTYHPAHVLRGHQQVRQVILDALILARQLSEGLGGGEASQS